MAAHRFGGRWTSAKLQALDDYLGSYATAMKAQSFRRIYIDAFAGSGSYLPVNGSAVEQRGSARIALDNGSFHEYFFVERDAQRYGALCEALALYPHLRAHPLLGDANEHLRQVLSRFSWRSERGVLFLDPYGMSVPWATLEAVARTQAIDVWYLFPLNGVIRQLARDERCVDTSKADALDRVLGTPSWRDAFYAPPPMGDLFDTQQANTRHASVDAVKDFVTGRLRELFPAVTEPAVLRLSKPGRPASGAPLFALYFMVANTRAEKLAMRIANGVLAKLRREGAIA